MPCPFPGMDPYLEDPALWSGVHQSLITYIRDALQKSVRPKYNASIGDRLYVVENTSGDYREPYLEIVHISSGEVITVIEILSPKNKTSGAGRDHYLQKQAEILQTRANLIEIDLLAMGPHTVAAPEERLAHLPGYRYLVSVRRPGDEFEVYAFALNQRLPRVAVPLKVPDPDVVLDLPALFNQAYENGGYSDMVDYTKPPKTTLSMMEQTWLTERLAPAEAPSEQPPD